MTQLDNAIKTLRETDFDVTTANRVDFVIDRLKEKNRDLKSVNIRQLNKLRQTQRDLDVTGARNLRQTERFRELRDILGLEDNGNLSDNVRAIKNRNEALEKHMDELCVCGEEISMLKKRVRFLEVSSKVLSRRNEDLRFGGNVVQSAYIELEGKILKLETENKVLANSKLKQTERIRELRNILGIDDGVSLEKSVLKLKNKNRELDARDKRLCEQIDCFRSTCIALDGKILKLRKGESDTIRKLWIVMDPNVVGSEDLVQRVKEMKLKNVELLKQVKFCKEDYSVTTQHLLNKKIELENDHANDLREITQITELLNVKNLDNKDLEYKNTNLQARVKQLVESEEEHNHCVDCCCARLWKVIDIKGYDGKDLVEHVQELKTENNELRESVLLSESNDEVRKLKREIKVCQADNAVFRRRLKTIEGIAK